MILFNFLLWKIWKIHKNVFSLERTWSSTCPLQMINMLRIFRSYGDVANTLKGCNIFRLLLGAHVLRSGRNLYCATPAVTRDYGFPGLIQKPPYWIALSDQQGVVWTYSNPNCHETICFNINFISTPPHYEQTYVSLTKRYIPWSSCLEEKEVFDWQTRRETENIGEETLTRKLT